MSKRADQIAMEHIRVANPSLWTGEGIRPKDFRTCISTYPIDSQTELNVSFELEDDGWNHRCELRDSMSGNSLEILHGYGIASPLNLADTIEDICAGRLGNIFSKA